VTTERPAPGKNEPLAPNTLRLRLLMLRTFFDLWIPISSFEAGGH